MKKSPVFLVLFFAFFYFTHTIQAQEIRLQPCVKVCIIMYADNSGSMDSAITDIHRWARSMALVPAESGYIEVGLYSFDAGYQEWCPPTGEKRELLNAIKEFSSSKPGGSTEPLSGLQMINQLLYERRTEDPAEWQILLIHSDYYWSQDDNSLEEIKKLISSGVTVVLSVPKIYDIVPAFETGFDGVDEDFYELVKKLGCESIRSNFTKFVELLQSLKAKVPCG